jgi:hypothetical protein
VVVGVRTPLVMARIPAHARLNDHVAEHHIDTVATLFKECQRRAVVLGAPPVVTLLRYPSPRHKR